MARPKKETIDYFPHLVSSGKTLFILESTFGNDGYAFWFKLLETLGATEGHYYDCNNSTNWRFLLAKTRVSEEIAEKILKTLSELEAIDTELWNERVIWVQRLVDNVADLYKRRGTKTPQRPGFCYQKPITSDVSDNKNPQSKVEESKVNKSKVESIEKTVADNEDAVPPLDAIPDEADTFVKVIDYFSETSGVPFPSANDVELAKTLAIEMPIEIIKDGIDEAFKRYKPRRSGDKIRTLRYCEGIIRDLWDLEIAKEGKPNGTGATNNKQVPIKFKMPDREIKQYTEEELRAAGIL